jgi:muramoyltetrapeptide carboxypeptidase
MASSVKKDRSSGRSTPGFQAPRVGIVAPSAVLPRGELALGVRRLEEAGWPVRLHPQCLKKNAFFAGTDEQRIEAFLEFALDPEVEVLWLARGGYGAGRLLPELARRAPVLRRKPKTLAGYSDATALLNFAAQQWGWRSVHAMMPGGREFSQASDSELHRVLSFVAGEASSSRLKLREIRPFGRGRGFVEAPVFGGNLTVLASLLGTPFFPNLRGSFLFLEEVDEALYRVDRLALQLRLSGALQGVRGILLGEFTRCEDRVLQGIATLSAVERKRVRYPLDEKQLLLLPKAPVRKGIPLSSGIARIFGELGEDLGVPVFSGIPAGHGGGRLPLEVGGRSYRLTSKGELSF